jgi:hypothetical protein
MSKNQKNGLFLKKQKKNFKVQKEPDPILRVLIGQTHSKKFCGYNRILSWLYNKYIGKPIFVINKIGDLHKTTIRYIGKPIFLVYKL